MSSALPRPSRQLRVSHPHINMQDNEGPDTVDEISDRYIRTQDGEGLDVVDQLPVFRPAPWIPPVNAKHHSDRSVPHFKLEDTEAPKEPANQPPPSFAQSEFETIIRRQRINTPHGLKVVPAPSRFPHLDNDWEFSGWGNISYSEIANDELQRAERRLSKSEDLMGQFRASSISGNGVVGSVFYAFPAVAAASSIFSPLALLIACLILTIYRPIFLELGGAIRLNGANYVYLLQCSGKLLAAIGAAATLLDAVATSVVSAATAGAYLKGEISALPIQEWAIGLCLLAGIALVALISLRESSALTLSITVIHMTVMTILMVASIVAWARTGMDVMRDNWQLRPTTSSGIARSIFNGVCIGFLGVTGFECTPAYIESIKPTSYGPTLRNLLVMALFLNAPLMLLVYALLPSETILSGANVLSVLAEVAIGRPLRLLVVVDCVLVLAGGVFAGVVTGCRLVESLAHEHVLPAVFLNPLPITGTAYVTVGSFLTLAIVVYASSSFSLVTVSTMFSATFLFTMLLDPVWHILLVAQIFSESFTSSVHHVNLDGLGGHYHDISGPGRKYCHEPANPGLIARIILWLSSQTALSKRQIDRRVIQWIRRLRRKPIVVWVKEDHVNHLIQAMLYIQRNEVAARVLFVHAYADATQSVPSELEANIRILDEAFPSITLDLVFVKGVFGPVLVEAMSEKLGIPKYHMFMSCPGPDHPWQLGEYQGVRVIDF
ncbi:amino acid permease [Ceratobasidium sp. AG-Ba]|nr:amino acid permease [Ceratobasidium sp. AG-Ba]QRW03689.1 amino acid permease [Ceratobasidium sp. AG-Ba]